MYCCPITEAALGMAARSEEQTSMVGAMATTTTSCLVPSCLCGVVSGARPLRDCFLCCCWLCCGCLSSCLSGWSYRCRLIGSTAATRRHTNHHRFRLCLSCARRIGRSTKQVNCSQWHTTRNAIPLVMPIPLVMRSWCTAHLLDSIF